jgi:hypothetical protein
MFVLLLSKRVMAETSWLRKRGEKIAKINAKA